MATHQLRIYTVAEGRMDTFVELWKQHVLPKRREHGFEPVGVWTERDANRFVAVLAHEGDFAEAEQTYFADPRKNPPEMEGLVTEADVRMLSPRDVG